MRVLVVEDEYWIRKGILEAIAWDKLGMSPAGEARNGTEALDLMEKQPVDVIITDMKMPGMGGDALLEELIRRGYRGGLIVLSEYSDYRYMRQAIHAQVDEYMLKPFDEQELNDVLLRIRNRLMSQSVQSDPMARLLNALAAGGKPPSGHVGAETVVLASLWTKNIRAIPFCRDDVPGCMLYWQLGGEHEGLLLCSFFKGEKAITAKLEEARKKWEFACETAVFIGVSGPLHADRAEEALAQAKHAALYYHRGAELIEYGQTIQWKEPEPLTLLPQKAFVLMLEHGHHTDAMQTAAKLMAPFKNEEWIYLPALRNALLDFGMQLDHASRSMGIGSPVALNHAEVVQAVHSPLEAEACLADMLRLAFNKVMIRRFECGGDIVEQILLHLRDHYADDLNLLNISELYHMNYIYLSRLFKKRTGVNFTDYLLKLRMEEAHRLLNQTSLRVKDVAAMVGYPNPYYFSSSYQKYFNRSPTEDQRGNNIHQND